MTREELESETGVEAAREWSEQRRAFARWRWRLLLLVTLAVCAVDQLSKHWAHSELQLRPGGRVTLVEGYVAFSYVRNPGAAWGFLAQSRPSFRRPFFVVVSLVAMVFILLVYRKTEPGQRLLAAGLALVMGGAVGNFIDRVRYGFVVDFIDLHLQYRFKWPTFNVADIAISVGVALLFLELIVAARRRDPEAQR